MNLFRCSPVLLFAAALTGCGGPATYLEAPQDAGVAAEESLPAWESQFRAALGEAEVAAAKHDIEQALAPLLSEGTADTGSTTVHVTGALSANKTYTATVRGLSQVRIEHPAAPELELELAGTFPIVRSTGLLTSSADCARDIEDSCASICRTRAYVPQEGSVEYLGMGPMRFDVCRIEGGIRQDSARRRSGICRVFQRNRAAFAVHWSYVTACTLHAGARAGVWACAPQPPEAHCAVSNAGPIATYAFACQVTLPKLLSTEVRAARSQRLSQALADHFVAEAL